MRKLNFIFLFLFLPIFNYAQSSFESSMDISIMNAKKGIYWAFENIPDSRSKINKEIIFDDKLIASVKLEKEISGIRIESCGFYNSYMTKIVIYRSIDSLKNEGYL